MDCILIADSGSTKCEWCLLNDGRKKTVITKGISPYFLKKEDISLLLQKELLPKLKQFEIDSIFFYGTGLKDDNNKRLIRSVLKHLFPASGVEVQTDLLAAARALCKKEKGISCILGTGSNSCYYNGRRIVKNSPGLGLSSVMKAAALILAGRWFNIFCTTHLMKN
jgi:N-acetylglucosamine kinase-like BadF-type ATPase